METQFTEQEISRFWSKVNKDGPLPDQTNPHYAGLGPCWVWTGCAIALGYGAFCSGGKQTYAHRLSFIIAFGLPQAFVLHKCDNRRCVNPSHLFDGTHEDNMADMARKGRVKKTPNINQARGARFPHTKLTKEQVLEIRALRSCKIQQKEIARRFSMSTASIGRILAGQQWAWLK